MHSHDEKTAAPFLSPDARVRTTFGVIGAIIAVTAAGVGAWVWTQADVRAHANRLGSHDLSLVGIDTRVRALEAAQTDIAVMKNDVQWIRRALENQRRPGDE